MTTQGEYRGRVGDVLTDRKNARPYDSKSEGQWEDTRDIRGLESTPLADLYFSDANLEAMHEGIRWRVNVESNGEFVISRQSDTELKIIMRSIFLQESRNEPVDVLRQVRELNGKVLAFCVPRIVNEVSIYKTYQRDISRLPEPMARGEMATSKGTKVLNMGRF